MLKLTNKQTNEKHMVLNQLEKKFVFNKYSLNCFEDYTNSNVMYFDAMHSNQEIEVKVKHDKQGHWTEFEVEYRYQGNEDWIFLSSFEDYID